VYRARDRETGEIVALKKVRMDNEFDGMPMTSLRELRILQLCEHPSIVKLKQVVTGAKMDSIFLVFEYCEHDMAELVRAMRNPFSEAETKCLMLQLLSAVEFLHSHWMVHRDLKLSNLLFNNRGQLKLCDFGLARFFRPVDEGSYTPKVVTLWYRAPELLLGATKYSCAIDMWAVGCILGELLLHEPLFPAKNEAHMLELHSNLLGSANERIWPGCTSLPHSSLITMTPQPYNYLKAKFPHVAGEAVDLLNCMLTYDPMKRITAAEALKHPYWTAPPIPKPRSAMPTFPTAHDLHFNTKQAPAPAPFLNSAQQAGSNSAGPKRKVSLPDSTRGDRFGSIFGGSNSLNNRSSAVQVVKRSRQSK